MKSGLVILILGLAVLMMAAEYSLYRSVFCYPGKKRPDVFRIPEDGLHNAYRERLTDGIRKMEQPGFETVSISSYDGCRLCGRLYCAKENAPLMIFFHGYHGAFQWDGYGCFKICQKNGMNILMVDERSHGKSGGREITFGVKERYDCKAWTEYAAERFGKQTDIFLAGVSMGAASVLMASGLGLPENVKAIVADCSYTEPAAIIKETIRRMKLPVKPVYLLLKLGAHQYGRFDLEAASPLQAVKTLKIPVLFIHGEKDSVVPLAMNEALYRSCSAEKKRLVMKEADHANCALVDDEGYEKAVMAFLKEYS